MVLDTTYDSNNENDLLDNDGQFDLDANTGVQAADPNQKVAFQRGISAGEVKKAEAQGSENLRIKRVQDEQSSMTQEEDGRMSGQVVRGVDRQTHGQMNRHVVPLIKPKQQANENKIKQNIHDDVFVFFQENFGTLIAYVRKDIQAYLNEMSAGLVLHAMKRALDYNKTNWNYVKKILQNWEIKGISSV
ncbi:DnaD domain protein [Virgibacillus sp. 179-BFC.A HS]|uniref:DnaD domain protein n=1 Tax=Tigheibacillus jepli TaxID=3035914 RepID=A0ABU5CEB1_9BACI|nr:DnaD domain protein [Virgibacillus sp. 179-BFC.A HS]MDY0404673.1 DnaD domain protein [Virgibacillus sp. 179-BFC.A HS]